MKERLAGPLLRDLRLWVFLVGLFGVLRAVFIFAFRDRIAPASDGLSLLATLLCGARYDVVVSSYAALPAVAATLTCGLALRRRVSERIRRTIGIAMSVLATALGAIQLDYFEEYGHTFDLALLGLVYDDVGAIARTILSEYHPLPKIAGIAVVSAIACALLRRWLDRPSPGAERWLTADRSRALRVVGVACCIVLGIGGMRGSLGRRPVQLKDAAVTGDVFLDQAVVNPFMAIRYALGQHLENLGAAGLETYLPDRDVRAALARVTRAADEPAADIDRALRRVAPGPIGPPPRHVFLIVGEGLAAWPLDARYAPLGLADELRELARTEVHLDRFLPSAYGTMASFSAIVTGLPDAGLVTNYAKTAREPYATTLPAIFHRLGYRTRLFYGGYLSWQRIGDFARDQGFDEIYGGSDMGSWASSNEWGVDDDVLFDFVLRMVPDDAPSLNVVLTTSLHPPFDIDVADRGFALETIPAELREVVDDDVDFRVLGHFWYADRCIGGFVRAARDRMPASLFAITGDHPARVHVLRAPDLFETRAVPLILVGESLGERSRFATDAQAGSHIDIAPTLVELAAPAGFVYSALGTALGRGPSPYPGVGRETVIGRDRVLDLRGVPRFEEREASDRAPMLDVTPWKRRHDDLHGIAWWRIRNGAALDASDTGNQ